MQGKKYRPFFFLIHCFEGRKNAFYEMDIRICNKSLLIGIKMNFYNEILLSPYRPTCIFYM